jgi:hypothetical protein
MTTTSKPSGLEKLKQVAANLGWQCLSDKWVGYHARYWFACENGHRFVRSASPLLYREATWVVCASCEADALRDRWLTTVAERGGELLNGPFTGLQSRYRLRCHAGHEWEVQGRKVSEGSWCPACAHEASAQRQRKADGLAQLQAIAKAQGGKCLAKRYTIGRDRYPFECAHGHRWKAEGHEVMRGRWCLPCARSARAEAQTDPDGLLRLQAAARNRNGECLTSDYRGQAAKYRFRCAAGHEWQTSGQNVLNGTWCRRCAVDARRLTIEDMRTLAAQRGGVCLSTEYVDKETKLTWQCHRGHVWQARPASVRNGGHWCPSCAILERISAKQQWKRLRYEASGTPPY